jgi:plastocyanin
MSRSLTRILAPLGLALVLAAGGVALLSDKSGSSKQSSSARSAKKTDRVRITDFKYKPPAAEVKVGSKITFANDDNAAHTATSKTDGEFDTGSIRQGEIKTVIAKKAGDFDYYCAFHPFMTAKIRVVD